jgi:hypothetical protein
MTDPLEDNPRPKSSGGFAKTFIVLFEALAVLAVIAVIAIVGLIFRLHAGPLSLDFAKDNIQAEISAQLPDMYVEFGSVNIAMPDLGGALFLMFDDTQVKTDEEATPVSVGHVELGFEHKSLLKGRFNPQSIIVQDLSLTAIRDESGNLDFAFQSESLEEPDTSDEDEALLVDQILSLLDDPSAQSSSRAGLEDLEIIEIRDTKLLLQDQKSHQNIQISDFDLKLENQPEGVAIEMATTQFSNSDLALKANGFLSRQMRELLLNIDVEKFDVEMIANFLEDAAFLKDQNVVFNAQGQMLLDHNLMPKTAELKISSEQGMMRHAFLSEEPHNYTDFYLEGAFTSAPQEIEISEVRFKSRDVQFLAAVKAVQTVDGYQGGVSLKIPELSHEDLVALWPQGLEEEAAEEWLTIKSSKGQFSDVSTTLDIIAKKPEDESSEWSVDANNIKASLAFKEMEVDYRSPLPPVQNGNGTAEFLYDDELLKLSVESGTIGNLQVTNAALNFSNIIQAGKGIADIKIPLSGSLADAFGYIENDPIGVNHKFKRSNIKGDVDLNVSLNFPTIPTLEFEGVTIKIAGTAKNATLPNVVKDLNLTGGPFEITVTNDRADVKGSGKLAGRDADIEWMSYLNSASKPYVSRVKAKLRVDENLRKEFGVDLSDFITGPVDASVTYREYKAGNADADIALNLASSRTFLKTLDYMKPAGQAGKATLKAILNSKGDLKEIKSLNVSAKDLDLKNGTLVFKSKGDEVYPARGSFDSVDIGKTQGVFNFEMDASKAMKIIIRASRFDLRPVLASGAKKDEAKTEKQSPPVTISLSADQMLTTDEGSVTAAKAYVEIDGTDKIQRMEFDARTTTGAGQGDIYLRYKPDPQTGERTFRLEADDAGAALKAFDLYDNVRGGSLIAYGKPLNSSMDRNLVGAVEMTDFRVVKAPGLAKLLGAMSLPGITQLLGNEGVVFSKMQSDFDWVYHPDGSILVMKEGRTSGNSLGLTFDGTFDNSNHMVDLKGTIIPLSGINNVLSDIPLLGDLLGGDKGLFAATYTIKGVSDKDTGTEPEVTVNPLSVLAPGFLRNILFQ